MSKSVQEFPIKTWEDFESFAQESIALMLAKDTALEKSQEFYLFRGISDCSRQLVSSLSREAGAVDGLPSWRDRIVQLERDLLNRFLRDIEPCPQLYAQYRWFARRNPKTETFWYLSVKPRCASSREKGLFPGQP